MLEFLLLPEFIILTGIVCLLPACLKFNHCIIKILTVLFLSLATISNLYCDLNILSAYTPVKLDVVTYVCRNLVLLTALAFTVISYRSIVISKIKVEYYLLVLFVVLAILCMTFARSLLLIYLSLELLALSLYTMVAIETNKTLAIESAIKFFIFGSISSLFFLLGIAFYYACSGQLVLAEIPLDHQLSIIACFLVFLAVLFKLEMVPMHFYVPDLYQGTNTISLAFIASVAKVASIFISIRIFQLMQIPFDLFLGIVVIVTVYFISVTAITETNIKRLLALSSISHVAFMLYGAYHMDYSYYGTKPILYYLVTYVLTQFLLFATLSILSQNKENLTIDSFKGLGWSSPVLSIILSICLLSLMGMPPLAGFFAKYMIFAIVVQKQSLLFSVLLIFSTVIAAYYYLRVFSNMYFFPAEGASEYTIDRNVKIVLAIALLSLLIIGFNPDLLLAFC